MARFNVPDGPGGEATMIWTLRPPLGGMVERMIRAPSVLGAGVAPELYDNVANYAGYPGYTSRQRPVFLGLGRALKCSPLISPAQSISEGER